MEEALNDQCSDKHEFDFAGAMIIAEAMPGTHDSDASHPGPEDEFRIEGVGVIEGCTKVGVVADDGET
eukprot:4897939-Prorocentrum_lima.AAC.1